MKTTIKQLVNKEIIQLFEGDDLFVPLDDLDNLYYIDEGEDIEQLLSKYLQNC